VKALDDVSLDVSPGELTLLMGPSGSGKSTLLAVLSGLLHPSAGQVVALGEDLWKMSDKERERFRLRHVGFVFQGYNLFPALTARQQLEVVLRWGEGASARAARKRAGETLQLLGLAGRAHLRPDQLSGGEKQRVAVARALVKKPTLCFADEPTGALDWANGEQVIELLRGAAKEGATVLVVAHDGRIVPHADRVLYLEDGRLRRPEGKEVDVSQAGGHRYADVSWSHCVDIRRRRHPMRSTVLSLVLGLAAFGALVLTPSEAQANWWARPVVTGYYSPAYYAPAYYYTPAYSYAPPVVYSRYYATPTYYYPAYTSYYPTSTYYYPAYTTSYVAPTYYYGGWYGTYRRGGYYYP
jgi:putative ABC transport system ATP-binding protein